MAADILVAESYVSCSDSMYFLFFSLIPLAKRSDLFIGKVVSVVLRINMHVHRTTMSCVIV